MLGLTLDRLSIPLAAPAWRVSSAPALALLLIAAACGPAEAPTTRDTTEEAATSGSEVEAPPPVPTGPLQSFVPAEHTTLMRLDVERVRRSSLSSQIGGLVREYPTWDQLLGQSGIDPIEDFNRVLVSAPAGDSVRSILVIRHRLTEAQVREAVLQMSVEQGEPAAWRDERGVPVVAWPAETETPRLVALTAEHELVVFTEGDLDRVVDVALDHRARRGDDLDALMEPQLAIDDGVIATVAAGALSEQWRSRFEHAPDSLEAVLRDDPTTEGRIQLQARGTYADPAAAEASARWITGMRDQYAGMMMVRAVGLDRVLREATIEQDGASLDLALAFTEEEAERVLGLLALARLSGG